MYIYRDSDTMLRGSTGQHHTRKNSSFAVTEDGVLIMLYLLIASIMAISSPIAIHLEDAHTPPFDEEDCSVFLVLSEQYQQYEGMEALGVGYDSLTDCIVITYSAYEIIGFHIIPPARRLVFWREFFGVLDGELRLIKTEVGTYIPEVSSRIEWPE